MIHEVVYMAGKWCLMSVWQLKEGGQRRRLACRFAPVSVIVDDGARDIATRKHG